MAAVSWRVFTGSLSLPRIVESCLKAGVMHHRGLVHVDQILPAGTIYALVGIPLSLLGRAKRRQAFPRDDIDNAGGL